MRDTLRHYGTKFHSGRYPWGSGEMPYQHSIDFLGEIKELKRKGLRETEIAAAYGMTTTQLRARVSNAGDVRKREEVGRVRRLAEKGMSDRAIAERLGVSATTVRNYRNGGITKKLEQSRETVDLLRSQVDALTYIDYGSGVDAHLGISRSQLDVAVQKLRDEGYSTHEIYIKRLGTDTYIPTKVLVPPGISKADVHAHKDKIRTPNLQVDDLGDIRISDGPPTSVSSKRVMIRYDEDGGSQMDGVVQLRRGVPELDLGTSRYAQVRIAVDGTHYIKGMAIYGDDMPDGVDIIVNSNKSRKQAPKKTDALKEMSDDPDNPFKAVTRPKTFVDSQGRTRKSALNVVNEEGSWDDWSRTLSAQFLSKQRTGLAKQQLDIARRKREEDFEAIMQLENPVVRRKMLADFASQCDSDSVHLKAAALPRQATQVILPITSMKPTEVYAPNYRHGEPVVLVRYPHGGTFEIPNLTVNNRHAKAKKILGDARDAIGIHPSVAERLSGADFDGDSVLVIPTSDSVRIKTSPPLRGLEGFDSKKAYPNRPGARLITDDATTQREMGRITNLIADMTAQGASESELARAVRHSMVVIDAQKHKLDYLQSEEDNDIKSLRKQYQGSARGGAATLITRAKGRVDVPRRKLRPMSEGGPIDPRTGELVYVPTGENKRKRLADGTWVDSDELKTQRSTKMQEAKDARTLISSSGTEIERVYADHANAMKALANKARLESLKTPRMKADPAARKQYATEVRSLKARVREAQRAAAIERQAQIVANGVVRAKLQANPDMTQKERDKISALAVRTARERLYAHHSPDGKRPRVNPTELEWEAIQKGAVSQHLMEQVLQFSDPEHVATLAMPKRLQEASAAQKARAKTMRANQATTSEIADALGISTRQVREILGGK